MLPNLFISVIKPYKAMQIGIYICDNYYTLCVSNISFFYYKSSKRYYGADKIIIENKSRKIKNGFNSSPDGSGNTFVPVFGTKDCFASSLALGCSVQREKAPKK